MKLILVNYSMDSKSLVFSHQLDTAIALSQNFESVHVFTTELPATPLPTNIKVFYLPWRTGSPLINTVTVFKKLYPFLVRNRKAIVFAHMTDLHSALISPLTWALKTRHVLWYAHAVTSRYLFFSSFFVSAIVSSTPGSCNLRVNREKIKFINQGISKDDFPFFQRSFVELKRILYYGRLDKSKNINFFCDLMDFFKSSGQPFTLDVFGKPSNLDSEQFMQKVTAALKAKSLQNIVSFFGQIERQKISLVTQNYDIFLNLFSGSLDKTLIEATFMGLPVVTWNEEYCSQFGTWSKLPVDTSLEFITAEIQSLKSLSVIELRSEIDSRRTEALNKHSFDGWIKRLFFVLAGEQV